MSSVAIVTGAGRGLGSYMAIRFGQERWRVVVNYFRSAQGAEEVAGKIKSLGGEPFICRADVRDFAQVKAMMDKTVEKWGQIDVLVNNAGGPWPSAERMQSYLLHDTPEEEWDFIIDSNLKGTFQCMKAVAPYMIKQGKGHIINISASTGIHGRVGSSSYAASKAGILGLSKSAAQELGEYNIKVNVVCPSYIPHSPRLRTGEANLARYRQGSMLHRTNTPEELADFIFYLTALENSSGQTFILGSRMN